MTAGTNISAGAMFALALSMKDADLYHLRDGSYCRPPSERPLLVYVDLADMESVNMLESKPMGASIMELLRNGPVPHRWIMETFPDKGSNLISYHMKMLSKSGLVERGGDSPKSPVWSLTEKGEKVLKRYRIRNAEEDQSQT